MKKLAIGGALAATVLGGSIAVAALTPIGAAFAGGRSQPVALEAGQTSSTPATGGQPGKGPGAKVGQALDDLVKDGTITQAQADKIKQKLESSIGRGGPGRRGPGGAAFLRPGLDAAAKSIGIPTADLETALKSGQSIAAVAQAHGVDPQKVINDLTAAATTKIDGAVASGKLKQDAADKLKTHLGDAISQMVNGTFHGFPGGRGPGRGAPGANSNGGTTGGPSGGPSGLNGGSAPSTTAPAPEPTTTTAPATSDTTAAQPSGTLGG